MLRGCYKINSSMLQGSQAGHQYSSYTQAQHNATIVRKLDTRHSAARRSRSVESAQRKVIITRTVLMMLFQSVSLAEVPMNHSAEIAGSYIHALMSRIFQVL